MKNSFFNNTAIFTFLLLVFISSTETIAQQNVWTQKADFSGVTRYGAIGFSIGNFGYMGAGYSGSTPKKDIWQYDPSSDTWAQVADLPSTIRLASTFVINGMGYCTGGIVSSPPYNKHLWMYNPTLNTWTAKTDFPGTGVYGAVGFAIGNNGYFGLGNTNTANGPYTTTFYEYDAGGDSWLQKASFPGTPRYGDYGIAVNGKGYVGFGGSDVALTNDWWEYDPAANAWTQRASSPGAARSYPTGFVIGSLIYLGIGNSLTGSCMSDFYSYNPASNSWTQVASFSGGNRWVAASFAINNKGYLGTGYDNINTFTDFWEYAPEWAEGITENQTPESGMSVLQNPCIDCEIKTVAEESPQDAAQELSVYNLEGRKLNVAFSRSANGYYINLPEASNGIFLIRNTKTGEVLKFVKE